MAKEFFAFVVTLRFHFLHVMKSLTLRVGVKMM